MTNDNLIPYTITCGFCGHLLEQAPKPNVEKITKEALALAKRLRTFKGLAHYAPIGKAADMIEELVKCIEELESTIKQTNPLDPE